jgi:hypothetical protein
VASLHPAATFAATADADPKACRHRPHLADIYLPLLGVAFVLDVTATERAARRQAGLQVQVGRAGGGHAVTVTAVGFAGLSSRVAWSFFWAAFREGRRLALAGTLGCFQRSLQGPYPLVLFADLVPQVRDRLLEACDDFLKLRNAFPEPHDTLISNGGPSVVDLRAVRANALVGRPSPQPTGPSAHRNALNKYCDTSPLDGTDHRNHEEQNSMIRRYIAWRNRHKDNEALRVISLRAKVA